jgi:hypothetical protein
MKTLVLVAAAAFALASSADTATKRPTLVLNPPLVPPGGKTLVTGSHFRPGVRVTIWIARAHTTAYTRLGGFFKANRKGSFTVARAVSKKIKLGKYLVCACQSSCRTSATRSLLVVQIESQP